MKYCRFRFENQIVYGKIEERAGEPWIIDLIDGPEEDFAFRIAHRQATFEAFDFEPLPLSAADLLPPVTPSKIVCVGRNYREHAQELGNEVPAEPLLFFKPPSALLAPNGVVRMPRVSERVDYEGELALVIGHRACRLSPDADWRDYVRGCTIANDVTARDLQKRDGQWTRAKGFDTFCPVGPWVSNDVDPVSGLTVETRVNGEMRQHGSTRDFIFPIPALLSYITAAISLEPGDLLLTGTPSGVGPVKAGDRVEITITGLGVLSNIFAPESA